MNHIAFVFLLFARLVTTHAQAQEPMPLPGPGNRHFLPAATSAYFEVRLRRSEQFHAIVTPRSATRITVELFDSHGRVVAKGDRMWRAQEVAIMALTEGTYCLRVRNTGDIPTVVEIEVQK